MDIEESKLYSYRGKKYNIFELMNMWSYKNTNSIYSLYRKIQKHKGDIQATFDDKTFDIFWFEDRWCNTSDILRSPKCKVARRTFLARLGQGKSLEDAMISTAGAKRKNYTNTNQQTDIFNLLIRKWI